MSSLADDSSRCRPPHPKPQSPRNKVRQDAYSSHSASAPNSPGRHTYRIRTGHGYPVQPQPADVTQPSLHDTTPSDEMRDHDDGDPHDLSFPKRHFPRASMVDNLVMSLDQFSPSADMGRTHRSKPASTSTRFKGHQPFASASLDHDFNGISPLEKEEDDVMRSASLAEPPTTNMDDEEEESQREKAYNMQRATQMGKLVANRTTPMAKARSNSNASSVELSHLANFAGRLGPAGNRRSQSFDFGSVRPKLVNDTAPEGHVLGDSRGPEPAKGAATPTFTNQTFVVRRNSGKSAKSAHAKKGRSSTVTANAARVRTESPLPVKSQTFDGLDTKNLAAPQPDSSSTPRAGFFKRVFGSSSRPSASQPGSPSPARQAPERNEVAAEPSTPSTKLSKQNPADFSQNKESQPAITKKPSSFFRRRKKSISSAFPPPLPLTLNNNLDNTQVEAGESSPVSSLRAFMDPYLLNNTNNTARHARGSSLQSVQHADGTANATNANLDDYKDFPKSERRAGHSKSSSQAQSRSSNVLVSVPSNVMRTSIGKTSDATTRELDACPTSPTLRKLSVSTTQQLEPTPDHDLSQTPKSEPPENPPSHDISKKTAYPHVSPRKELSNAPSEDQRTGLATAPKAGVETTSSGRVLRSSGSDTSVYKSAPSTPLVAEIPHQAMPKSPAVHVSHPSLSQNFMTADHLEKARKIFDNTDDEVDFTSASAWLGEASPDRERVRMAYMSLFDWSNHTILNALRNMCSKLILKGETQQVDRVLDAFASRWCECNASHGFRSADIVHTICYSVLLLNTDLHMADIGKKMTRNEFVRNAMDTIKHNVLASETKQTDSPKFLTVRTNSQPSPGTQLRPSMDRAASSLSTTRPNDWHLREESAEDTQISQSGPLVEAPFSGSQAGWELQMESVLRDFYLMIAKEPLPLFGSQASKLAPQQSNSLSAFSTLRRTPSTLSKATSETRSRYAADTRSLGARWSSKTRSRPRLGSTQAFGSSRTSFDDQSSAWSPSMSSTWSKVSLNKTLTSMSVESFGTEYTAGGYQSSIGFANALSQAIIRDEQMETQTEDGMKAAPLLEDESLELYGAPWAKEGILKHKCHLEGVDKRSKDRNWNDCFAVIEKGWMRLFSFSMTAKSLRNKARSHKAGTVVGGGNWQDNAEEVWKFMLRHTIASSLPPPGYSKQRPYVWALSLPNGAVHLFSVGTPDIVKEFVSTANFWSARLSKEPMTGGVSSMEYGWSDSVVNRSLTMPEAHSTFNTSSPRPSTQLSMRSSVDHGTMRPKLPGDKAHISEWTPPQQSLMASQLMEIDQLKALQAYVKNIEDDLQKHNELRGPMLVTFSARHPNSQKAMTNWEKKSSYLLREIVKFRTYIDALQNAEIAKEKVKKMKEQDAA